MERRSSRNRGKGEEQLQEPMEGSEEVFQTELPLASWPDQLVR
jgi:hypothetical protein